MIKCSVFITTPCIPINGTASPNLVRMNVFDRFSSVLLYSENLVFPVPCLQALKHTSLVQHRQRPILFFFFIPSS